jgi:DNA polymerase I-like protein with 3'-5' exonuclease and polymerase domains
MHPRVMKKFRLKLKRVVYGSSYGLSAGSVAQMLTLEGSPTSRDEAQSIQDGYLGIYPGLRHWRDYTMQDNRESNLLTPFGRQLQLDVITDATFNRARNQAWAFKPQSIATDICVHAALDLHYNILPDFGAHLVASVHDALYAESPVEVAEEVKLAIETTMTASAAKIYHRVPFPTDGHISRNWNEC